MEVAANFGGVVWVAIRGAEWSGESESNYGLHFSEYSNLFVEHIFITQYLILSF